MKVLFFALFILLYGHFSQTQQSASRTYRLIVSLENAPFDSLSAYDYSENRHLLFRGEKISRFTWVFDIPDSVAETSDRLVLMPSFYNPADTSTSLIRFFSAHQGQSPVVNIGFQDRVNHIRAVYKQTAVLKGEPIRVAIHQLDSVVEGNQLLQDFDLLLQDDQSDITVRSHDPYFAWFLSDQTNTNRSYEDQMSHYLSMAEKFPDSRYLMANLSDNLLNFRDKMDVRMIYERLSEQYRDTRWADKIEMYLQDKFQNDRLSNLASDQLESVIQDSSRHNLVIFAASWCGPCIEEIPLLKEVYAELSHVLIMTYVSLDQEKDIASFQQILTDHAIPWRTLYAYPNIQRVQDQYMVASIPHVILVSPDMDYIFLDIRLAADRKRLYSLGTSPQH